MNRMTLQEKLLGCFYWKYLSGSMWHAKIFTEFYTIKCSQLASLRNGQSSERWMYFKVPLAVSVSSTSKSYFFVCLGVLFLSTRDEVQVYLLLTFLEEQEEQEDVQKSVQVTAEV